MSLASIIVHANRIELAGHADITNGPVNSRMLLRCLAGEARVQVNGSALTLRRGDLVFLPWGHTITYFCAKSRSCFVDGIHCIPDLPAGMENPIIFRAAHTLDDALARATYRRDGQLPGLQGIMPGRFAPDGRFDRLCQYVIDCFVERVIHEDRARGLAELLLAELASLMTSEPSEPRPANLLRVTDCVRANLPRRWSVDELCELADCSSATLTRLFRRHHGISPMAWVIRQRLGQAAVLLATRSMPIYKVAEQVGISDGYYFSRLFAQHYRQTPRAYRRLHLII